MTDWSVFNAARGQKDYRAKVSENGLAMTAFGGYHIPRLSDCKIALLCERNQTQTIGNKGQTLVFGEVKEIYLSDDRAEMNEKDRLKVYADKVQPLARSGAGEYASFGEILNATRPT